MTDDLHEQIRRLEALVASPAGSLAFPALAEAHRRAGRPEEAERVARAGLERAPHVGEGRIALALALLDQKRDAETRVELERLLGADAEHAIAHDAAAFGSPEGLGVVPDEPSDPGAEASPPLEIDSAEAGARDGHADPDASLHRDATPDALLHRDATPDASLDADTDEGAWLERDTDSDASLDDDPRATGGLGTPIVGDLATLDPYPDEPGAGDDERPWASRLSGASRPDESAAVGPFGAPPPPAPADPLVFDEGGVRDEELDSAFDEAESDRDQMLGADDVAQAALSTVPDEEDGDGELDPLPRVDVADGEDDFAPAAARPAHAFDVDPAVDVRDAGDAEDEDENDDGALADPGSPFATETVAGLLERQGHAADAERLRERIASIPAPGAGTPPASGADATPAPASAPGADATPAPASATADDGSADRAEDAEASEPPPRSGGPAKQATLERWLDNLRRDKR